jgi:type I restriction enzyme S subunit
VILREAPIAEITEAIIDYRGKTPPKSANGIRLLTAKVIKDGTIDESRLEYISEDTYSSWMRRGFPRKRDILITTEAPLGETAILRDHERVALAQRVILLRGDARVIDQQYLFAALRSPLMRSRLLQRATGTTVLGIKQSELRQVLVPLPPLSTQRKIGDIVSAYDDLIENDKRRIEILEEMARRIYREWFVDFRYPGHPDVWPTDSELGLPPGWLARPLSGLATVTMGQSPPSAAYNHDGVGLPFHQGVGTYGAHFPTHEVYSSAGARIAERGDTLVSVRAPVGRINVADRRMILGRGLCGVRAGVAPATFLLHALKEVFREEDIMGGGTIFKSVTRHDMEDLRIRWPGEELAREFADVAEPIWSHIHVRTLAIDNLRAAQDVLLPRLISGAIEVAGLSIAGPEAA